MTRSTSPFSLTRPVMGLAALTLAALLAGCSTAAPTAGNSPAPEASSAETHTPLPSSSPSLSSAAPSTSSPASASAAPAPHWAYNGEEGPDHWGELASEFSTCGTGSAQSPIDLPSTAEPEEDDLVLAYSPVDEEATDTGHTLQLNVRPGAGLAYGGEDYTLLQLHYHDPSEHTIDGAHAPIEFHFVNQDSDGNLLVIGVLGITGAHNDSFDPLVAAATAGATPAATVDVSAMMPAALSHFAYEGSLTTPPCTEDVQWLVMDTPVELGQEQIDTLKARYDGNNRPVQPLNGREVHIADQ